MHAVLRPPEDETNSLQSTSVEASDEPPRLRRGRGRRREGGRGAVRRRARVGDAETPAKVLSKSKAYVRMYVRTYVSLPLQLQRQTPTPSRPAERGAGREAELIRRGLICGDARAGALARPAALSRLSRIEPSAKCEVLFVSSAAAPVQPGQRLVAALIRPSTHHERRGAPAKCKFARIRRCSSLPTFACDAHVI